MPLNVPEGGRPFRIRNDALTFKVRLNQNRSWANRLNQEENNTKVRQGVYDYSLASR